MVNTALEHTSHYGGAILLGASDVMKELEITKMTLYKWILQKKIKAIHYRIGARVILGFNEGEVERIKSKLKPVKDRKPGKSLFQ